MRMMLLKEGQAQILDVNVISTMTQEEMVDSMRARMAMEPVFVPHGHFGCAMAAKRGNRTGYLMYISPDHRRKILYESQTSEEGRPRLLEARLWMPHTYILVKFRRGAFEAAHAYMAHRKVRFATDRVCISPLPNVYQNGTVCNGDAAEFSRQSSPEENAEKYVRFFMNSHFSQDILDGFRKLPPEFHGDGNGIDRVFQNWAQASLSVTKDGAMELFAAVELNWTIGDVLNDTLGEPE